MSNTKEKFHWWLASYVYFTKECGQGFGNYVQGTDFKFFDNDVLSYSMDKASKEVGTQVALTSISYLGEMTKEQVLGG